MKLVAISDTHLDHGFTIPDGDILVHAGDLTVRGTRREMIEALDFLRDQPHQHKIIIAGNHDLYFETLMRHEIDSLTKGLIYLQDSGCMIEGLRFYGAPWQPRVLRFKSGAYHHWAFNIKRGKELRQKWQIIPDGVDVLITHTPPRGTGDQSTKYKTARYKAGCSDLRERVWEIKPKVHIFGHVHHGYGEYKKGGVYYANAALCNYHQQVVNRPIEINYDQILRAA